MKPFQKTLSGYLGRMFNGVAAGDVDGDDFVSAGMAFVDAINVSTGLDFDVDSIESVEMTVAVMRARLGEAAAAVVADNNTAARDHVAAVLNASLVDAPAGDAGGGGPFAAEAARLGEWPVGDLTGFCDDFEIDRRGKRTKADLVGVIVDALGAAAGERLDNMRRDIGTIEGGGEADPVRAALEGKTDDDLVALAGDHNIDLSGMDTTDARVDAIVAHLGRLGDGDGAVALRAAIVG